MDDRALVARAAAQDRCVSREDLRALGYSRGAIRHRVRCGRLVELHEGVYAVAPVLPGDHRTRWRGATMTSAGSALAFAAAAGAYGFRPVVRTLIVVRPGSGGPRMVDGVRVHLSSTLDGNITTLDGIAITSPERTMIDVAPGLGWTALRRMVREAARVRLTTVNRLLGVIEEHRNRRGIGRLRRAVALYADLPVERGRSDAEVLALWLLREAGRPQPLLNEEVAGEEADLVWPAQRRIVELDGPQFHLDRSEDLRKQELWEAAGWTVLRLPTDDVYFRPERLVALAPDARRT